MTILLDSIRCDVESDVKSFNRLPRQFTYTRLVNGTLSICRDMSCLGYDGLSLTHTGDIIRHRPLIIDRFTGLIHTNNVQHSIEENGLDLITVNTFNSQEQLFTVQLLLQVFYGLEFVDDDTMTEYFVDSNDVTIFDLVADDVVRHIPMEHHCRYAEYFTVYIPGV